MISEHFIMPYIFGSLMAQVARIAGDPRAVDSAAVMARSIELSELMAAIFNKEKDVEILDRLDREIYDQIVRLYKSKYTSRKNPPVRREGRGPTGGETLGAPRAIPDGHDELVLIGIACPLQRNGKVH